MLIFFGANCDRVVMISYILQTVLTHSKLNASIAYGYESNGFEIDVNTTEKMK